MCLFTMAWFGHIHSRFRVHKGSPQLSESSTKEHLSTRPSVARDLHFKWPYIPSIGIDEGNKSV